MYGAKKLQESGSMVDDLYIITEETIEETVNDYGEVTCYIKGKYSLNGEPFKECIIIWDEEFHTRKGEAKINVHD